MVASRGKTKPKGKRKPPKTAWKPGQSGNPAGRPKDGESWSGVLKELSNMTADELAVMVGGRTTPLGQAFLAMPKGVQIKYLVSARAITALMFEPTSSLWNSLMDRVEGKVPDRFEGKHEISSDAFDTILKEVYGRRPDTNQS